MSKYMKIFSLVILVIMVAFLAADWLRIKSPLIRDYIKDLKEKRSNEISGKVYRVIERIAKEILKEEWARIKGHIFR